MTKLLTKPEFLTVKEYLKDALAVMDDCGRENETGNSVLLWDHQWKELRDHLFFAWEILDENWDGTLSEQDIDE